MKVLKKLLVFGVLALLAPCQLDPRQTPVQGDYSRFEIIPMVR